MGRWAARRGVLPPRAACRRRWKTASSIRPGLAERASRLRWPPVEPADLITVDPSADALAGAFVDAGFEIHLVGGTVRDALLGRESDDLDFATDARPDDVLNLLRGRAEATWTTGIEFGTIGAQIDGKRFEITTFRADRYDRVSRNPEIEFGDNLLDDLRRRDFTMNAMALSLPDRTFHDPFGGLADLARGVVRTPATPEESFADDPLRMLRAVRFVAQLDGYNGVPMDVDADVLAAMKTMAPQLGRITAERVQAELTKLLLGANPHAGLVLLTESGLAEVVLPELPQLKMATDEHGQHKDVYAHTLQVLDQAIDLEPEAWRTTRIAGSHAKSGRAGRAGPGAALGRAAARHRQARHPSVRGRRAGQLPSPRGRRGADGQGPADRAAVPQGADRGRLPARLPAPALLRLRRGRMDRRGRAALRDRRRPAARPAEQAGPLRLHHPQPAQGGDAGRQLRQPGPADRVPAHPGGDGEHPSRPGRQRDHADPGHPGRADWSGARTASCSTCAWNVARSTTTRRSPSSGAGRPSSSQPAQDLSSGAVVRPPPRRRRSERGSVGTRGC